MFRPGGDDLIEYDFHLAPGGEPARLALRFEGARAVELGEAGELRLHTPGGVLTQRAPIAYQEVDGERRSVAARFVLRGPARVGFEVGAYDRARPLVIDPPLTYGTYLGGDGTDQVQAIAVDGAGATCVTGLTASLAGPLATDFPTAGPLPGGEQLGDYSPPPPESRPFPSIRRFDAFVGKLDTSKAGAESVVYLTFLGGVQGDDRAFALAVDDAGRAHVGGVTSSRDFPMVGPLQTCRDGQGTFVCDLNNSFLARLSADGATLEYGSYLAGNNVDEVAALALGPTGHLYVGGRTASAVAPALRDLARRLQR